MRLTGSTFMPLLLLGARPAENGLAERVVADGPAGSPAELLDTGEWDTGIAEPTEIFPGNVFYLPCPPQATPLAQTPAADPAKDPAQIVQGELKKLPWKDRDAWFSVLAVILGVVTVNRLLLPRIQKRIETGLPPIPDNEDDDNENNNSSVVRQWVSGGFSAAKKATIAGGVLFAASRLGIDVGNLFNILGLVGGALLVTNKEFISNAVGRPLVRLAQPFRLGRQITVDGVRMVTRRLGFQFIHGTGVDECGDDIDVAIPTTRVFAGVTVTHKGHPDFVATIRPGMYIVSRSAKKTVSGRVREIGERVVTVESHDEGGVPVVEFIDVNDLNPRTTTRHERPPILENLRIGRGDTIRYPSASGEMTDGVVADWNDSFVWLAACDISGAAVTVCLPLATLAAKEFAVVAKGGGESSKDEA